MIRIARAALVAMLAVVAAAPALAQPLASPTIDPRRLETVVDRIVHGAMRQDRIAGVSVAIVDASAPLLIKGYGIAAPGRAVDADTLFPMQSISKTMVWIALMQLVEQGRISLDDPINAHLPAALQIPAEGFHKPILVRDLMSHTAGFEDSALGHLFVDQAERLSPLTSYLASHRVHRVREPGAVVVYSNYGGALGGAIVEHVTGMRWEDYAEQRIIRPLGMGDATFRQPYPASLTASRGLPPPMAPAVAARLTDGFRRGPRGLEPAPREFTSDVPAGALVASPTDMAAYMGALLDPQLMQRSGVLKAQTLLAMRAPLVNGPAGFGDLRHGFEAVALPGGYEGFGHGGDSIYQVASMTLIPDLGLGVFVSANTASGRRLTTVLRQALLIEVLGAKLSPPVYGQDAVAHAQSFAGEYRDLRRPYYRTEHGLYDLLLDTVTVSAAPNGDLELASLAGPPRSVMPLGGGVYRDRRGPDRIAFRPLAGRIGLYDPYGVRAWERIGFFDSPRWVMLVIGLTVLAAVAALVGTVARLATRRSDQGFERYAGAVVGVNALAWLAGLALFFWWLFSVLTAAEPAELMWSYPPPGLVWACWVFAAAAALTLAALPSLAVVVRSNGWSVRRKAAQAIEVTIFLACAATFLRLGLLGFSGW